jgi:prepilin-type processing-associated H-X9-DG protein
VGELALAGKQWPPGNHPHDNSPYVGQVWENLSPNPLGAFPIRSGAGFLVCKSDLSGYRCDQGCLCSYMGLSKYGWHHLRQENLAAYEYHQIQEFDEPTRRIMLCETEPAVFQSGGCGCRWTAYSWPDEVIKRHYGGGNILFFDGHVELAKDPEKRKLLYWEPDYKATWPGW